MLESVTVIARILGGIKKNLPVHVEIQFTLLKRKHYRHFWSAVQL